MTGAETLNGFLIELIFDANRASLAADCSKVADYVLQGIYFNRVKSLLGQISK